MSNGRWEMERMGNRRNSVSLDLNLADVPGERDDGFVCITEEEGRV